MTQRLRRRALGLAVGVVVLWASEVLAGNGWNPPVKPEDEKHVRQVGSEFFKLEGRVYLFLGSIQEGNIKGAQEALSSVRTQIESSAKQCAYLANWLKANQELPAKYDLAVSRFEQKTTKWIAAGAVLPGDPVWPAVAKLGLPGLIQACTNTVEEVRKDFDPVSTMVEKGNMPSSQAVWKLMGTLETGSKRSRYFSLGLQAE